MVSTVRTCFFSMKYMLCVREYIFVTWDVLGLYHWGIHPTQSFYVYQARMRLFKSLTSDNFFSKILWSQNQNGKRTFCIHHSKLVESEGGYFRFEDVCQKIDKEIVELLIEYNMRPYFNLCKDLTPHPKPPKAIITAESPVTLNAMKELVTALRGSYSF